MFRVQTLGRVWKPFLLLCSLVTTEPRTETTRSSENTPFKTKLNLFLKRLKQLPFRHFFEVFKALTRLRKSAVLFVEFRKRRYRCRRLSSFF